MASKLVLAIAVALSGSPLWGQELQDNIVSQLRAQGYSRIEVSRTFLGRTRIVATSDEIWREIVINPNTGLILRDYFVDSSAAKGSRRKNWFDTIPGLGSEGNSGPDGNDDEGDDDGDDDGGDDNEGDGNEGNDGGDDSEGDDSGEGENGDD